MSRTLSYPAYLLATAALLISGCAPLPLLRPPGPLRQQQIRASVFDLYGDNDAGPEIVGGRPRDFQKPAPEAVRNSWFQDSYFLGR